MTKKKLEELKPAIKFLLEEMTHSAVAENDLDVFVNGGKMWTRQHVGYNYDIVGEFKLVKDTDITECIKQN